MLIQLRGKEVGKEIIAQKEVPVNSRDGDVVNNEVVLLSSGQEPVYKHKQLGEWKDS